MSRNPILKVLVALALILLVAGAGPARAGDRKVTIDLEDAEGEGITLSLSGKWLNEAVLDSIGESIEKACFQRTGIAEDVSSAGCLHLLAEQVGSGSGLVVVSR